MNSQYRKPLPGSPADYFDTRAAVDAIAPGAYATLPYVSRVLAEQLVDKTPAAAFAAYSADLGTTIRAVQDSTASASRWYVPRSLWRQTARDMGMALLPARYFERYFQAKYSRA